MITHPHLAKAMSYKEYKALLESLLAQGKTTGHTQSEEYLGYAKINLQRMARLEKTTVLDDNLKHALSSLTGGFTLVAVTEGWCGDAAQNLPVFDTIAREFPGISLKLLLRDDNPEVMDSYLTNGARAIPKVIALENSSLKELFVWGPRPAILQEEVKDMIARGIPKPERGLVIQKWYNSNKTQALQAELTALIRQNLH